MDKYNISDINNIGGLSPISSQSSQTNQTANTPETFKNLIVQKYPNGVTSDGQKYSDMDATDLTKKIVSKYPDGVTSSGVKYSDYLPKEEQQTQQDDSLISELAGRVGDIGGAIGNTFSGKINPASGLLQTAGGVAGGITDIAGKALELIPGVKQTEGLIGKGVSSLAQTEPGKAVTRAISDFSQKHPELSADIGSIGNILGVVGLLSGAGAAKEVAAKALGKEALGGIIADVTPELSAKAGAKSIAKQGLIKTALTGEIKPAISEATKDIAQTVADNIPGFSKLKTFTDKLNVTKGVVSDMADKLKNQILQKGQDILIPVKEVNSAFNKIEEPISLKGTPFEKQVAPLKKAAIQLVQDNGGTVSGLFDARKAFDSLVEKTYPSLYDKEYSPIRTSVKSIRDTMNDLIEKYAPEGSGYKDSLQIQSKLLRAVDNLAPKAYQEIGSTRASRFAERHPTSLGLLKNTAKVIGGGTAAGLGIEGAQKIFGQ